jgi:hypothetical protein
MGKEFLMSGLRVRDPRALIIETHARDDDPDRCPVREKAIEPGESTGSIEGETAHLDCWIRKREEARRARPRPQR